MKQLMNHMMNQPMNHLMKHGVVLVIALMAMSAQVHAQNACCSVTQIDLRTGTASAKENAGGRVFQFKPNNAAQFKELRVGLPLYANFAAKAVSLDGHSAFGTILGLNIPASMPASVPASMPKPTIASAPATGPAAASAATAAAAAAPSMVVPPRADAANLGAGVQAPRSNGSLLPAAGSVLAAPQLPIASYGTPQRVTDATPLRGTDTTKRAPVNPNLVHLSGISGIKSAANVPDEVKDLLVMHASALPPDQVDHYIVNVQLAAEWVKTHPEPASAKGAASKGDGHTGCNSLSIHCAQQSVEHAEDEASRQSAALLKQAQDDWNHVQADAARAWGQTLECLADHTLTVPGIPVKFSIAPSYPMSFDEKGSTKNDTGSASGEISGTVAVGLPVTSDFTASIDLFYIPCLPFVVRPKSIGADGALTVGSQLTVTIKGSGQFSEHLTLPPGGGLKIPVEVIPIIILGVPVVELDASIYLEGSLDVQGKGTLNANATLTAQHKTGFDFNCDGKDCQLKDHGIPVPDTAAESVQLNGRIRVTPAIYAALQLDFEISAFGVRAGPQPYLTGEIAGCYSGAALQSTMAATTTQQNYALTADLDWGLDLRADALVGDKVIISKDFRMVSQSPPKHLYFKDLAHSTALIPAVRSAAQPSLNQPMAYTLSMPSCYPYPDPVEYSVSWTGSAVASNGGAAAPVKLTAARAAPDSLVGPSKIALANSGAKDGNSTTGKSTTDRSSAADADAACLVQGTQADCWGDPAKGVALDLDWPTAGSYNLMVTPVKDKHGRIFQEPQTTVNVQVQQ